MYLALQIVLGFLASVAVLFVPGLLLGRAIGLRWLWLFALAPLISLTLLSGAAVLLPRLGQRWELPGAAAFAVVFGLLVTVLFRVVLRPKFDFAPHMLRESAPALLLAMIVLLAQFTYAVGSFSDISQTYDNVFHLNAIRHVELTGHASPFLIGSFASPDSAPDFYPSMWHAAVQLVQQLSGNSIPIAINVFNMALMATVWPLGVLLLARGFTGLSRLGVWIAALLAVSFPAFPLLMLFYGVLYPYFMGLVMLPAALALILNLLRVTPTPPIAKLLPQIILLLGIVPGMMLTHPQAVFGVLALSVPAVIVATFTNFAKLDVKRRWLRLSLLAVFIVSGLCLLIVLRRGFRWGTRMEFAEALQQTLLLNLWGYGTPILFAVTVLVGVVATCRRPFHPVKFTLLGIWAVGAALFLVSAGVPYLLLRFPTLIWYADAPRLASLFVIAAIPILASTLTTLFARLSDSKWLARSMMNSRLRALMTSLLVSVFFAFSLGLAGFGQAFTDARKTYALNNESALLSSDEKKLLEELDEIVPAGDVVVGSPWTGASLAYAIAAREALLPHILMGKLSAERTLLTQELDEAVAGGEVCAAVAKLRAYWVLDFGSLEVHGEEHVYPGFDTFPDDKFTLVKQIGAAKLYRVTACD